MAKKVINVGITANDKKGDSLRASFVKINENFTELYTALGLNSDGTLNLGAFEFTGSVMSTTDSTAIVIDQSVTVSSDLTIGGDIVPNIANGGNLGSPTKPFKSLYVSNNTVFLGGVPLSLDPATNELQINNVPVSQTITYTDIPNAPDVPTDISDLTDTQGLLGGGGTADLTITVPGNPYKGFGARYGRVYNNSSSDETTVSKIVIYKQAADTTSSIDPTGSQDNFAVAGLSDSDIVAMFILYGDTNGAKDVSTLRTFAQAAIDNVILNGGVQGSINTLTAMRSAFYNSIGTLTAAAGGLVENFEFYENFVSVNSETPTSGGAGTGFKIYGLSRNSSTGVITMDSYDSGLNYQVNDVIIVPGNAANRGTTPENDISITVTQIGELGEITGYTVTGNLLGLFYRVNSISDGGNDQYDTANFISTNLANDINYNQGNIVSDSTSEFGAGSSYTVVYDNSIFGILAVGTSVTQIRTSGNSGADGNSATDTDELVATDKTYDPGLTNLILTNRAIPDDGILFVKADYATANDVDVIEDDSTLQIGITRGVQNGIYNPFQEEGWDQDVSPAGTLWNIDGWDDLSNLTTRTYTNFYAAYGGGGLGNKIPGSRTVMYVPALDEYYAIQWLAWTQNANGGGFSYIRYKINKDQAAEGLKFADGTVIKSAEGLGRVKSTAENNRRIEEVTGYKNVEFTSLSYATVTSVTSRAGVDTNIIYVPNPSEVHTIANNYSQYVQNVEDIEFSLDNTTWYRWSGSGTVPEGEYGYYFIENPTLNYNQGDTVYLRYQNGGLPVVWWDQTDLPSGSADFRGAVIDYHAYDTYSGTIIGTIHIVRDSGENYITHTEVNSGDNSLENSDLWLVQNEGTISYRRLDGNASRLKIHWTAKVFYGSEFYD